MNLKKFKTTLAVEISSKNNKKRRKKTPETSFLNDGFIFSRQKVQKNGRGWIRRKKYLWQVLQKSRRIFFFVTKIFYQKWPLACTIKIW
jgi:hypothetical protein